MRIFDRGPRGADQYGQCTIIFCIQKTWPSLYIAVNTMVRMKSVDSTKGPAFKSWAALGRVYESVRKLYLGREEVTNFQFSELRLLFLQRVSPEYLEATETPGTRTVVVGLG